MTDRRQESARVRRYYGRVTSNAPVTFFRDGLGGWVLSFWFGYVARRPR